MRALLILAHGQPSDPLPAAAELEGLAARVAVHLPGWQVVAATLAETGALERLGRLAAEPGGGLVLPVFMAGGWFTRVAVPGRLEAAGFGSWRQLEPMGTLAAVQDLAVRLAQESGAAEILVAAHGSGRSREPARIACAVAERIAAQTGAQRVGAAFIEEAPFLSDVAGWGPEAVCLPFFAMSGGHVIRDLPEALAKAGFPGRILPALGLDDRIPALIAQAALEAGPQPV